MTRGILPFLDSEAELVGVLGHEIGHVTARHSAQQYTRTLGGVLGLTAVGIFVPAARPFGQLSEQALAVLFLRYGRDDELQADRVGAGYVASHGWDPRGVPAFLATLGRLDEAAGDRRGVPNWLSTHPDPLSRVAEVQPLADELASSTGAQAVNRDAFFERIDGIMFGDNPEHGVTRGSVFLHPGLRFRLEFPAGYEVANSPDQVVAKAPGADVYMILQLAPNPQGEDVRGVAVSSMQSAGFRLVRGEPERINGLDAFSGVYDGTVDGLGSVTLRAAHIAYGDNVYMIAGLSVPELFQQVDAAFIGSTRSFRSLSAAEAEEIRPNRVRLYVVRAGDSWQSIAESTGGIVRPVTLAAMNGGTLGSQPQAGTRIKVVVEG